LGKSKDDEVRKALKRNEYLNNSLVNDKKLNKTFDLRNDYKLPSSSDYGKFNKYTSSINQNSEKNAFSNFYEKSDNRLNRYKKPEIKNRYENFTLKYDLKNLGNFSGYKKPSSFLSNNGFSTTDYKKKFSREREEKKKNDILGNLLNKPYYQNLNFQSNLKNFEGQKIGLARSGYNTGNNFFAPEEKKVGKRSYLRSEKMDKLLNKTFDFTSGKGAGQIHDRINSICGLSGSNRNV